MLQSNNAISAGNQQGTLSVSPNLINHKWGTLRDYTPNTIEFSDELVTLIALLYTDGGISKHRMNSWRIFFANTSIRAIEIFRDCLVKIFGIAANRVKVRKTFSRYYFATLTSKEIGSYLVNRFGGFRTLKYQNGTYPSVNIPTTEIIKSGRAQVFLRTVFSMDGGVKFYTAKSKNGTQWLERCITLACHHPKLRRQYTELLKAVGVNAINIYSDKVIKIRRRENFEKFIRKISFLPGIKTTRHSKFWVGVEKNKVLRMMVDSYLNPSKYLSLLQLKR